MRASSMDNNVVSLIVFRLFRPRNKALAAMRPYT